eukprot:2910014-Prymnesium_polylepis.1
MLVSATSARCHRSRSVCVVGQQLVVAAEEVAELCKTLESVRKPFTKGYLRPCTSGGRSNLITRHRAAERRANRTTVQPGRSLIFLGTWLQNYGETFLRVSTRAAAMGGSFSAIVPHVFQPEFAHLLRPFSSAPIRTIANAPAGV